MMLGTGSSGFIGSTLTKRVQELGIEFCCFRRRGVAGKDPGYGIITIENLVGVISKSMGRKPLRINLPLPLINLAAYVLKAVKLKVPITVERIPCMTKLRKADNTKAKEALALRFTRLADGLARTANLDIGRIG